MLPIESRLELKVAVSFAEIQSAVWLCGSDKAPGPDGFTFAFIKKYWDKISGDIYMTLKDFERLGNIDKGCNSSFITLIQRPTTLILLMTTVQ
uniref:Reverse transcriptase domain-containing protein n=1 Tax=Lactuca sativa TaxID=4236 RepID=A0A9R1W8A1_LACSA|nr:hypothetical protein LSAT_V11C200080430 [Lactuca sativa]